MPYQIELKNSEAALTAVVRERVQPSELSRFVPAACGEVWSFARSAGLPKPGRHTALYLDAGLVEAGAEVSEPFVSNDRVHCSQLPPGRVATTAHFGPYQRLSEAHTRIRHWCAEHGHLLTGVAWEIYGHWDESWNATPSKIRTDVFYQLKDQNANNSPDQTPITVAFPHSRLTVSSARLIF
jgi:effector-binding domain-containing protein